MFLNSKYLKISRLLFCLMLFYSCKNAKNDLNCVSFISNKKILLDKNINTASPKYRFKNNYYPIEKDTYFDVKGNIIKVGVSKGEGLLFYYRSPSRNQLGLNEGQQNFKIQINRVDNIIIENNDTIRSFEVNCDNKIIYYKNQRSKRTAIYSFE